MNITHSSPWITKEDIESVQASLCSGMIAHGSLAEIFGKSCADFLGLHYAHVTNSGQAAIERALLVLGVSKGAEVVMPSYVCRSVENAVMAVGGTPVYCDIGEDWCIDADAIKPLLTSETAAIIAVHPFGIIADLEPLLIFDIPVIEDCCQCFSSAVGGKGVISVFSFQATKCLTTGEGGLIATSDTKISKKIEDSLKSLPEASRMSDIQAALGISQLARYPSMLERRKEIAAIYLEQLPQLAVKGIKEVKERSIFFRFPLTVACGYDVVASSFQQRGVHVRRGVDVMLHCKDGGGDGNFPCTLKLFKETLSLPIYPALNNKEIKKILDASMEVLG